MSVYMGYDLREHETYPGVPNEGAVLYIVDGQKQWVPKKAIEGEDANDKVVIVADWFARSEGIESDW